IRDFRPAMRERHRRLFMEAKQHLRLFIAEPVDDAVMEPAIRGAGIERDIRNIEGAHRIGSDIAAPETASFRRQRPLDGLWLVAQRSPGIGARHDNLPPSSLARLSAQYARSGLGAREFILDGTEGQSIAFDLRVRWR